MAPRVIRTGSGVVRDDLEGTYRRVGSESPPYGSLLWASVTGIRPLATMTRTVRHSQRCYYVAPARSVSASGRRTLKMTWPFSWR
jgi:hypothetical protein